MRTGASSPEKGIKSPGSGVTGRCKLTDEGSGN